jgi:hypothetical protein
MDNVQGVKIGNIIECEGGRLVTNSYFEARGYDTAGNLLKEFKGVDRHMQNFIDVVHSRRNSELYGPIDEGRVSSALCHLGNISHLVGAKVGPGEIRESIAGDAKLSEAYGRMAEHLGRNNVDIGKTPLTLGAPLAIDDVAGRFTGENSFVANALLTREYRAPFAVPQLA